MNDKAMLTGQNFLHIIYGRMRFLQLQSVKRGIVSVICVPERYSYATWHLHGPRLGLQ